MAESGRDALEPGAQPGPSAPSMVVGIGASAGGINALQKFFRHVPGDTSMAFVVILHLSPDHESRLAEVLQTSSPIPVTQVHGAEPLRGGRVYVAPPSQTLEASETTLRLSPMTRPEERRAPVDMFFRALADAYGSRAAAVVLSGTGPNGSSGIKRVKEHAGLTIAQDPAEAEYRDMPANSIATGLVDYVLRVAEIPGHIAQYESRLRQRTATVAEPPQRDSADEISAEQLRAAQEWRDILTVLRLRTGQDFANYKPATLRRRVERRLNVRGLTTLAEYARLLREHPDEPAALMRELLISVTSFFRDREAFAALERRVIPALFHGKQDGDQVRVWSAGCATGEEAYSVAMLLADYFGTMLSPRAVQVFATDLDEQAIAHAREGLYTEADVADVPSERLQRYFHKETGGYRVRRELRELVLFAHHNVIRDPPFSHLDLIVCRNLLIYLNRTIQERLLDTFHFALRPAGYLFLGTSESVDGDAELFVAIDKNAHIFESRSVTSPPGLPIPDRVLPAIPANQPRPTEPRQAAERLSAGDLHLLLLEQYAPASLVVNEENVLLHTSPRAARYLEVAPGEPTRDVLKLVLPALRADLRTGLHLATQQRSAVEVGGIRVHVHGVDEVVKLVIRPALRDDDPPRGYFLVLFEDASDTTAADQSLQLRRPAEPESRRLEDELQRVKTQLRATIEQYETHSEEARAANEELQAMNEELRSSAEELETSKEELQSVNEELTTVNQELKIKIEELGLTNNDFQNLINATDIGTIFLDRSLRVKMSTPAAQKIFNLLPSDTGRKLSDITSRLTYEGLHDDVVQVLDRLQTIEREVRTREGRHYLMRVLPYRTLDDRIDGVCITFHDVSAWRQAERRVRASEERLRLLIDRAIDYAIFTITEDGRVDSWNPGAQRMFGFTADEIIGRHAAIVFTPEDRAAGVPQQELETAARTGRATDERWHMRKDGTRLFCSGVTTRLGEEHGLGFAKIARDLTAHRRAQNDLEQARETLEERVAQRTMDLQAEVERRTAAQEHAVMLLRKLVTAQEDERARIARDLHDQLGQQLTGLRMTLERLRPGTGREASADLDRALELAGQIDRELDFLAWELRPPVLDDLGLTAALPRFVEAWSQHYGIAAQFHANGQVAGVLSPEAELTFYRIAQEALTNVAKHAEASRVDLLLERRDHAVVLVVEDNGIGFEPTAVAARADTGLGLIGMHERAALIGATLQIESTPDNGTSIYLQCPIAESEEART